MIEEPAHSPGERPTIPGMNEVEWAARIADARARREKALASRKQRTAPVSPLWPSQKQAPGAARAQDTQAPQANAPAPTRENPHAKLRLIAILCIAMVATILLVLRLNAPETALESAPPQVQIEPQPEPPGTTPARAVGDWKRSSGRLRTASTEPLSLPANEIPANLTPAMPLSLRVSAKPEPEGVVNSGHLRGLVRDALTTNTPVSPKEPLNIDARGPLPRPIEISAAGTSG